ncbi:hypothetical protein NQD34_018479 [Periophthalmus magnuspinnatus]|nr:hypothetical protein NQD34_018479 [Periophthalmus magnuspinnatus]
MNSLNPSDLYFSLFLLFDACIRNEHFYQDHASPGTRSARRPPGSIKGLSRLNKLSAYSTSCSGAAFPYPLPHPKELLCEVPGHKDLLCDVSPHKDLLCDVQGHKDLLCDVSPHKEVLCQASCKEKGPSE